jgi:hypothetical protein
MQQRTCAVSQPRSSHWSHRRCLRKTLPQAQVIKHHVPQYARSQSRTPGSAVLSMSAQKVLCMCPGVGLREFTFDGVFGPKVRAADAAHLRGQAGARAMQLKRSSCRSRRRTSTPMPQMHPLWLF